MNIGGYLRYRIWSQVLTHRQAAVAPHAALTIFRDVSDISTQQSCGAQHQVGRLAAEREQGRRSKGETGTGAMDRSAREKAEAHAEGEEQESHAADT